MLTNLRLNLPKLPRLMEVKAVFITVLGVISIFATDRSAFADSGYSAWDSSWSDFAPVRSRGGSGGQIISLDLDPQNILDNSFRIAAREDRLEDLKKLMARGARVNSETDMGETALMYASRNCSTKMVKFLLDAGADVNHQDADGRTSLIFASRESCTPVIEQLTKVAGINLGLKDQLKKTALDYAEEQAIFEVDGPSNQIISILYRAKRKQTVKS